MVPPAEPDPLAQPDHRELWDREERRESRVRVDRPELLAQEDRRDLPVCLVWWAQQARKAFVEQWGQSDLLDPPAAPEQSVPAERLGEQDQRGQPGRPG